MVHSVPASSAHVQIVFGKTYHQTKISLLDSANVATAKHCRHKLKSSCETDGRYVYGVKFYDRHSARLVRSFCSRFTGDA